MHPKTHASRSSERTRVLLIRIRESNRVVFIAATRVTYLAEMVIKSYYFVGLESGKLIA